MTNLERWRVFLQDLESPDIFIDATFYAMISAALQRNLSWRTLPHKSPPGSIFPNIYFIFIGPSGIGKSSAANWGKEMFKSFGGFDQLEQAGKRLIKVAPSSITLQQLYRYMSTNYTIFKIAQEDGRTVPYMHSSLAFFATEEIETLMTRDDEGLVPFLTEGWNAGDFHRETKGQGVDYRRNMCVTLLGCATQDWVRQVAHSGLLKRGFAARAIFFFGDSKRKRTRDYRFDRPEQRRAWEELRQYVNTLTKLYGKVQITAEADQWFSNWYNSGGDNPINPDSRLIDYYGRKKIHLMKMAMLMHFADSTELCVELDDVLKALEFLSLAERDMHKALLGSGKNPAYDVACAIQELMERSKNGEWHSESALLLHVFGDVCTKREDFDSGLRYLLDLQKLRTSSRNGKTHYQLADRAYDNK